MSDNKKLEIVSDNGKQIKISKVYEHIEMEKPKKEEKKDIVIPKVKNKHKDDK